MLAVKILVVLALAALGRVNRYAIVARLPARSPRSPLARVFRRARLIATGPACPRAALPARFAVYVTAEATLAVVVFACTAVLGESTPAAPRRWIRTTATCSEPPGSVRITMDALHAQGGVPSRLALHAARRRRRPGPGGLRAGCSAMPVTGEPASVPATDGAGPDLTGMGEHHPAGYLAEAILNPNAVIVEGPVTPDPTDARSCPTTATSSRSRNSSISSRT